MDDRITKDGSNFFSIATDSTTNEIYTICYQNKNMRNWYRQFGETLHIDGTYMCNDLNYALYFFSIKDSEGKK